MQTEARVRVVVEGGQRVVVDGGAHKFVQQQKHPWSRQSQISTVSQLLAGGIAGAFSKTCTAPLARLTILFQVQGMHSDVTKLRTASIWREASRVIGEEGFRAFWKGNLVTIVHRLPYSSVSFYAYERYSNLVRLIPGLDGHRENLSTDVCVRLLGGGLAGVTAASATYPLDLVRTRLAAQGVGPNIAISFSCYDTLRSSWLASRPHDSTALVSLACGSLSGFASSTITFPLDLVRRRMQLEGAAGRARVYKAGLFRTFGHIIRTEGPRGLYRGILPEYYKVVPGVAIVFMTYEKLRTLLPDILGSA
ncbi:uncharacterized protein LOC131165375 isoform X3 [Malania oleifera]|uniref:uncharacterized protein LOC131165375 isoform X3 n=1 Tax=Malania oleifera TaxID=397392 RepID=UPI0025AD9FA2|nr:uncharacterized protein LOC131165375 isoform X3 [Malania oleifera]